MPFQKRGKTETLFGQLVKSEWGLWTRLYYCISVGFLVSGLYAGDIGEYLTCVLKYLGVTGHQGQLALKVQKKTNDNRCINTEELVKEQMQKNASSWGI